MTARPTKKKKGISWPRTFEEQTLTQVAYMDHGMVPPSRPEDRWYDDAIPPSKDIPRSAKRKFRKAWRKARKVYNETNTGKVGQQPTITQRRIRRQLVKSEMTVVAKKLLNNEGQ